LKDCIFYCLSKSGKLMYRQNNAEDNLCRMVCKISSVNVKTN
jgi:hypothetical protein